MKQIIRDYLTFNRRERNGVFVLLCIILLLTLYLSFSGFFYPTEEVDLSKFEKEVREFEEQFRKKEDSMENSRPRAADTGFSGRKDNKGAGRQFPYSQGMHNKKYVMVMVELNAADTAALISLRGIGPGFAKRIVKFRDLLGGFIRKEQLLEVYGFDQERYDLVAPQVMLDTSLVKKLNINTASADELGRHPYIGRKTASKIYWYRVNHGSYSDVSDVLKYNLAEDQLYSKLAGYLTVK